MKLLSPGGLGTTAGAFHLGIPPSISGIRATIPRPSRRLTFLYTSVDRTRPSRRPNVSTLLHTIR